MATTFTKTPMLRNVAQRTYATSLAPVGGISNYDVKTNKLPNKLVVAAADNNSPITRISVIFGAGARHETHDNYGVTHVLRIAAGLSTCNSTQFAIMRNIQQVGANVACTTDRETIAYTLEGTRGAIEDALPFLTEMSTQQVFKPWEISDNVPRLRYELATRPLQLRAIDLLHKAAFRTGLGNSLFIAKHQLGKISTETLQHYYMENFVANRAAVVGLGVDPGELSCYAQKLKLECNSTQPEKSCYKGGEIRSDKGGNYAYVAIGVEGVPMSDQKEALASGVIQFALGVNPALKWAPSHNGLLHKAVGKVDEPYSYALSAFNANYSDSGLFGVLATGPADMADRLVKAAACTLKDIHLSDADICRGKNLLKTHLLLKYENGARAILDMANQALLKGCVETGCDQAETIDSLSDSVIHKVAKKLSSSKLSIASVGNLTCVPFLDELE